MVSRWKKIKNHTHPLWDVAKADLNNIAQCIRVKVKKPLGDDSHIKIKGNALTSEWYDFHGHTFYIGKEVYRIHNKRATIELMNRLADSDGDIKARVEIPRLEEQVEDNLWKQRLQIKRRK